MFILDKLLLSPLYATVWAARQIQNAIEQERAAEPEQITAELRELYMRLETGQMREPEFNAREKELLDRLEALEAHAAVAAAPAPPQAAPRKRAPKATKLSSAARP
ncbi:MAG: gas vesicle protein GvpG [Verrucomicrobia bacterium]|nr:gas vesicle protein GvpG [Verrucomicrobiota bacterium]